MRSAPEHGQREYRTAVDSSVNRQPALALCGDGEDWDADGAALISKLCPRGFTNMSRP